MTEITGMFINKSGFIRVYTCTERKSVSSMKQNFKILS